MVAPNPTIRDDAGIVKPHLAQQGLEQRCKAPTKEIKKPQNKSNYSRDINKT
jgi:hypothetical protein